MVVKDILGRYLNIGDIVAFSITCDYSPSVNLGFVKEIINEREIRISPKNQKGQKLKTGTAARTLSRSPGSVVLIASTSADNFFVNEA